MDDWTWTKLTINHDLKIWTSTYVTLYNFFLYFFVGFTGIKKFNKLKEVKKFMSHVVSTKVKSFREKLFDKQTNKFIIGT